MFDKTQFYHNCYMVASGITPVNVTKTIENILFFIKRLQRLIIAILGR
jgi:hypothetical protein